MSLPTTTLIILSLQIIITCFLFTASASSSHGFTVDLIHRRSNSSLSQLSKTQLGSPYADIVMETAEYLIKLQIGSPPVEIEAGLDTGSDLVWIQCLPCLDCYDQYAPIFDPSTSSTFKQRRCNDNSCPYQIVYADGTYSKGTFVTETVTLHSTTGEPFVMAETIIACGHKNSGFRPTLSGNVGLDWGSLSLISQMGETFLGLISYCFAGERTSKINFGVNAIVVGDGTVSANMFMKREKNGFYYLNLDAVSVGDNRIETLGTPFYSLDGNILIDSGTTYTYLPERYCNQVMEAVANVVTAGHVDTGEGLLCYNSDTIEIFPDITMHFSGSADLVLDKYKMYMEYVRGTYCLTIMCSDPTHEAAVFGNRAQNNLLVGYDPSSLLVSFKPTDCSTLWN